MDTSRATFLSSWTQELRRHPETAWPLEAEAHGALSAHLLAKDDTTLIGMGL